MLPAITMIWLAPNGRWLSCKTADGKQHFLPARSRRPNALTDCAEIEAAYKAAGQGVPRGCIVLRSVERQLEAGAEVTPAFTNVSEDTFRYEGKPPILPDDIQQEARAVNERHAKLTADHLRNLRGE